MVFRTQRNIEEFSYPMQKTVINSIELQVYEKDAKNRSL